MTEGDDKAYIYECRICGAKFVDRHELNRHIKEKHRDCEIVLEIDICFDDFVTISSGRNIIRGRVKGVGGTAIVIDTGTGITSVKKNKINFIERIRDKKGETR